MPLPIDAGNRKPALPQFRHEPADFVCRDHIQLAVRDARVGVQTSDSVPVISECVRFVLKAGFDERSKIMFRELRNLVYSIS
jgi:hypothetical protein